MQTKNKLVALGCGLVLLTTSSLSFANESSTTSNKIVPTPSIVNQMTPASWSSKEISFIWTFIKAKDTLTEEEYKALSTIYANYHSQIKEVISNTTLSQEEKNVKILDINKTLFETLKPYIDSTKLEAYEKWVAERLSNTNWDNNKNNNPTPPKPTTDCSSQGNVSAANTEIKLTAKLSAPYKVSLEWSDYYPKGDEDLLGYKIVVKNPNWEEKIVSVGEDDTEKDDWNSKVWMNIYKVYAVTNDWSNHESNTVNIPMNGNWGYDFSLIKTTCTQSLSTNNQKNDKKTWDIANVGKIVKDALNIGKNIVKKVKFQYKLLSEKTRQLVNTKIDSIPKEKREEYLKNLLVKIDKLIGVTKSTTLKAKLEELRQVVQEKLDELSWTSSDESIIQDLLNDSSNDSSTSTTKQETNEVGK